MRGRIVKTFTYLAAAALAAFASVTLYPIFNNQSFSGVSDPFPTLVVYQNKALGSPASKFPLSVYVQVESRGESAKATISQVDVNGSSAAGAEVYVALEYGVSALEYRNEPVSCRVTDLTGPANGGAVLRSGNFDEVSEAAVRQGDLFDNPYEHTGSVTVIAIPRETQTFDIECLLPEFRFARESLATWNLYLPAVDVFGVNGAAKPSHSYWAFREPSDFIQQVSQSPSEVLVSRYSWYPRNYDLLARQGLFLTVSNPALQQESAYRLFIAGALLGLAGGFFVAGVDALVQPSRSRP